MNIDEDTFQTMVIAWAVIVTIILAVLVPYTVNLATLPSLFYKTLADGSGSTDLPGFVRDQPIPDNPKGLLVWYNFEDDLSRTFTVIDRSGGGNHATIKGVFIGNAPGIIGNRSVSLPGTGYLYSYPSNPAGGRTNVSFSLWFTVPDRNHNYRLASGSSAADLPSGWILGTQSSELWDDNGDPIRQQNRRRPIGPLTFDTWNHKVLVYNGSYVLEYLNGHIINEYTASGKPVGAAKVIMIGSWQPFGQNYAGQLDEFRIYNRSLSDSEILDLYHEGYPR
jgi:hypothetical protein